MRNCGAHAISVGISCDKKIRLDAIGKLKAQIPSFAKFWIGIRAGGEITIGEFLLGNNGDVVDAKLFEDARDALAPRAVKRRIDDLIPIRSFEIGYGSLHNVCDKRIDNFLRCPLDEALFHAFFEAEAFDATKDRRLCDRSRNFGGTFIGNLTTIFVVDFVTVIDARIMRSSDYDTSRCFEVADSKRQRRHGLNARIHIHVYAISSQNTCRNVLEFFTLQTRIARDRNRWMLKMSV